jgi:lysophospholipase L1-like esterase
MRALRILRTTIIVLAITAGLYTLADYIVGLWRPGHVDVTIAEGSAVPAYRNQPYVNADFIREKTLEPGEWRQVPGQYLVTPSEYHGTYFNVDKLAPTGNLYRRTANPPPNGKPERVVLLVGGSTLYGPEVPDDFTIASQVSARLNALDPEFRYVVYNAGVVAADSAQDRDRVAYELSRGLKPYMVIAIDGPLDIVYGIYQGRPGQPAPLLLARTGWRGFLHKYLPTNIAQLVHLWFHDRAVAQHQKVAPPQLASPPVTVNLTQITADLYVKNLKAMAKNAGSARFLAVLPPSPFSTPYDHKTPDLEYARIITEAQMPKVTGVLQRGQAALSDALAKLKAPGVQVLDLSAALKAKTVDVFVDQGHLNATGYGMLADRIAQVVLAPVVVSLP